MIVDDEPDILEFVGYNLINEGFKVEKTNNGKDAIALNNSFKPDLIILDVMMPELDGIETCYQIKKDVSINDPKILFLTARSEDYSEISGLAINKNLCTEIYKLAPFGSENSLPIFIIKNLII